MPLAYVLLGLGVVCAVALLAVGRFEALPDATPDRAPLAIPEDRPMASSDIDEMRFAVALRGYRMDEVDDVLDHLAGDLADRDARIAALEAQVAGGVTWAEQGQIEPEQIEPEQIEPEQIEPVTPPQA